MLLYGPPIVQSMESVKNPVLPHGASSKEKAILAIHPCSSERGILAFSRDRYAPEQTAYSHLTTPMSSVAYFFEIFVNETAG